MTTQDMVDQFLDLGYKAMLKHYRNCPEGIMLTRKEPIVIKDIEFHCWREYVVYLMAEYINDVVPDAEVEVELDGNESSLKLNMNCEQQRKLNGTMANFLRKYA